MADCGLELPQPLEPVVGEAKLQERLAQYMELELFQMDIGELIRDYKAQGLPVPPLSREKEYPEVLEKALAVQGLSNKNFGITLAI